MINLIIDNSYCKIEGLSIAQHKELADLLSYELDPQAAYFAGGYGPKRRTLLSKKGEFPSGLLYIVNSYLKLCNTIYSKLDKRIIPSTKRNSLLAIIDYKPYDEQIEAVVECEDKGRGTVSMVTGFGKSITMALLIGRMTLKTLVIVPNLGLKQQLSDTFLKIFGSLNHITVENIDSPKLEKLTDFDMLIIDESHHVAASTYRHLNKKCWNGIYYRFFFTGTAFRSRDEEQLLMESISGQVIYSVDYHKAVEIGAIVPIEAYYVEVPKQEVEGYTYAQVYNELVVNNKVRNRIIADLLLKLHVNKLSTLCLVKEIKHGENLVALTGGAFVHGNCEDTSFIIDSFNKGKLTTLIGTTGVLGEGVDTKPAEFIIIAGLGKSRNQFIQQVGRGLRKYPGKDSAKIIIFKDLSHKWTAAHFKAQCKILLDVYGVKPVLLKYKE